MKQKISNQELLSVSKLQPFERYQYFLKRVADFEVMYTLEDNHSNLALAEVGTVKIISFWSAPEYAIACAIDEWNDYKVREISLNDFESMVVPEIQDKGLLINIFSIPDKTGFIVDVNEFNRDLDGELEKYE
ncbi:DUF2750 domain-containing protein [Haliscomenobacter sp.]|uniref:DUF2750 domain-containing protein n=1 Tax=Haliscomenobacter sp. TaxID=2717303 RepID=UPI0035936DB1